MLDANQAYWKRSYQDAITDYQQAAGKIYALFDPQFNLTWLGTTSLSRDPALFEGFVSISAEYLNVLPVNQPSAGPQPRVAVEPGGVGKQWTEPRSGD